MLTSADKRLMQSLFNSAQQTIDQLAEEFDISPNKVREIMGQDIKPSCIDRLEIKLARGKTIYLDVPCYGTLSYDDVSDIQDAIFSHYFPKELNECLEAT